MEAKHVQAELLPHEYAALKRAAKKRGLALKEAVREAALEWAREAGEGEDPLFGIIGIAKRATKTASARHDDIYLED